MMKYGCPSPKRLLLRSNWCHIWRMDLGRLPREERLRKTTVKTASAALSVSMHASMHMCPVRKGKGEIMEWHQRAQTDPVPAPTTYCFLAGSMCFCYPRSEDIPTSFRKKDGVHMGGS